MLKRLVIVTTLALAGVVFMFGMVLSAHAVTIDLYAVSDAEITGRSAGSYVNTHNWGGLSIPGRKCQSDGRTDIHDFPNFGDSRGLFKFDLSSIPAGATIDSATVSLYVGWNAFSPVSSRLTSVSLYQVTSAWTETGRHLRYTSNMEHDACHLDVNPGWPGSGGSIPFNGYINGGGSNITNLVQVGLMGILSIMG